MKRSRLGRPPGPLKSHRNPPRSSQRGVKSQLRKIKERRMLQSKVQVPTAAEGSKRSEPKLKNQKQKVQRRRQRISRKVAALEGHHWKVLESFYLMSGLTST